MSFARRSSAFSRFRRFSSASSSEVVPGRRPASVSARITHNRTVSDFGPSFSATEQIASHLEPYSCSWSSTILTARSRNSSGYLLGIAPSSQGKEPPPDPGRFRTNQLTLRHSTTFEALRTVAVTDNGRPVNRLNELECVGNDVWANIWQADTIVRINPDTGTIITSVDASDLLPPSHRANAGDLNGIAYRSDTGTFLLTGKNWPYLYEVTFNTTPTTVGGDLSDAHGAL